MQSKGEEITRAVAWASLPLVLALIWAWGYGTLAKCARWPEWKTFFAGAYSDQYFEKHSEDVFHATKAVFWTNFAVLWRMYLLVCVFWLGIALCIRRFGAIRRWLLKGKRFRRVFLWSLNRFIIPRISEWHVFLSTMLLERKDVRIHADILTKSNILYRGWVADKMLNKEGELNAIILESPSRFRREEYLKAKESSAPPEKDNFWAEIPGHTFMVMASEMVSLNITQTSESAVLEDPKIIAAIRKALNTVIDDLSKMNASNHKDLEG